MRVSVGRGAHVATSTFRIRAAVGQRVRADRRKLHFRTAANFHRMYAMQVVHGEGLLARNIRCFTEIERAILAGQNARWGMPLMFDLFASGGTHCRVPLSSAKVG